MCSLLHSRKDARRAFLQRDARTNAFMTSSAFSLALLVQAFQVRRNGDNADFNPPFEEATVMLTFPRANTVRGRTREKFPQGYGVPRRRP